MSTKNKFGWEIGSISRHVGAYGMTVGFKQDGSRSTGSAELVCAAGPGLVSVTRDEMTIEETEAWAEMATPHVHDLVHILEIIRRGEEAYSPFDMEPITNELVQEYRETMRENLEILCADGRKALEPYVKDLADKMYKLAVKHCRQALHSRAKGER